VLITPAVASAMNRSTSSGERSPTRGSNRISSPAARKTLAGKVLGPQPIAFRSNAVEAGGGEGRLTVRGELTMAGGAQPVSFDLRIAPGGELTAATELVQSDFGIKPYRGLMGALKVRDSLEILFEGRLPA